MNRERPWGYGLDDNNVPYPIWGLGEWMAFICGPKGWPRQVGRHPVGDGRMVSTTFLGSSKDELFETAIISWLDGIRPVARYDTWQEAEVGHGRWVSALRLQTESEGRS